MKLEELTNHLDKKCKGMLLSFVPVVTNPENHTLELLDLNESILKNCPKLVDNLELDQELNTLILSKPFEETVDFLDIDLPKLTSWKKHRYENGTDVAGNFIFEENIKKIPNEMRYKITRCFDDEVFDIKEFDIISMQTELNEISFKHKH